MAHDPVGRSGGGGGGVAGAGAGHCPLLLSAALGAAGLQRHSAWPAPASAPAGFLCRPLIENSAAGQPVNSFNPFLPSPPPLGQALLLIRATILMSLC